MRYVPRLLEGPIQKAARSFPALILTGPRRSGKTTLLRRLFPAAQHVLLEDPDVVSRVRADPRGFLAELSSPVILDEIQNAPELFAYVRTLIDQHPRRTGRWLLTGSQESQLMRGVTESMAGRAAIFQLLSLSHSETPKVDLLHGGFPEALARPVAAELWFRSYLQTYLERDVRAASAIRDLATYRRFLSLLASRVGQILNKTDLSAPLGVSVPTVGAWLSILELTGQILLVPPYHENFGKRLVKAPRLYFTDTGLAAHLLGIESLAGLRRSPFLGPLFECWVAAEIVKIQLGAGRSRALYFFRDQQGLEVDFVVPRGDARLLLLEAKATATPRPEMARAMQRLAQGIHGPRVEMAVVSSSVPADLPRALAPGVRALTIADLPAHLLPGVRTRGRG
jgi:uncharacterized protein